MPADEVRNIKNLTLSTGMLKSSVMVVVFRLVK
jgi:hypothetical protein